jgi:SOS response regulatory protein OraA/RecX
MAKKTKGQRKLLHRVITKKGYSLEEIREIAKEIKELYPHK